MQASIDAADETSAQAIAADAKAMKDSGVDLPSYSNSSRKLLTEAELRDMVTDLLTKTVANTAADEAKLTAFEPVTDTFKFNIDIVLGYPAGTSAAAMDADAEAAKTSVKSALTDAVTSSAYNGTLDISSIAVTELKPESFTTSDATTNERDATLKIMTGSDQTAAFQTDLESTITDSAALSNKVQALLTKMNAGDIVDGIIERFPEGYAVSYTVRFMDYVRDGDEFSIITRIGLPSNLPEEYKDYAAREYIKVVDTKLSEETSRKLLAVKLFNEVCGSTSPCVFDGASYQGFTADLSTFAGAAAVRALFSGLLLSVAAFMLLA